jgi:hypothetical protein
MIEIDPGLDLKLQGFFEHVEASSPPLRLTHLDLAAPHRARRTFNLFVGLAAAAIVAASAAVFAVELGSHHGTAAGPAASSPTASPSRSAAPLVAVPLIGPGGVPASAHVVIPTTRGRGSLQLQTFVPQGTVYIQFSCAGPGPFDISSTNRAVGSELQQCSASFGASTITVEGSKTYDDKPLTLKVTADPSMVWELYVAESQAPLAQFTVHADEQVLIPVTYGSGSVTLPTFSAGPDEWINVEDACISSTSANTLQIAGNPFSFGDITQYGCSNPSGSGAGSGGGPGLVGGRGSGPISVHVKADPSVSWEILITAGPTFIGLSSSADVAAAPAAYGMGPDTLATFSPTQTYSVAFVCSGVGALTIASSTFTHIATPSCGGNSDSFTPPNQVPGEPVVLSVDAPPSVGWEIYIYYDNGPDAPTCPPAVIPGGTPEQREAILAHDAAVCADRAG